MIQELFKQKNDIEIAIQSFITVCSTDINAAFWALPVDSEAFAFSTTGSYVLRKTSPSTIEITYTGIGSWTEVLTPNSEDVLHYIEEEAQPELVSYLGYIPLNPVKLAKVLKRCPDYAATLLTMYSDIAGAALCYMFNGRTICNLNVGVDLYDYRIELTGLVPETGWGTFISADALEYKTILKIWKYFSSEMASY